MYARARDVMAMLAEKNPSVPEYQMALAEIHFNIGQTEFDLADRPAALVSFEQARTLLLPLLDEHGGDARYRDNLATTSRAVAKLQLETNRRDEARKWLQTLLEHLRKLARRFPLRSTSTSGSSARRPI